MLKIKSYTKKDGKTYYKFQTYLGTDETGKIVRAARQGFKSKAEARRKAMGLKAEFQESGYQKPTYETFEEIYKLWYDTIYREDVRESTAVKTKELFNNHILKDLGAMRIAAITPKHCQVVVKKWSETLGKAKTMKNYCKRVFDYAITLNMIKSNPMERVHVPKQKTAKKEINFYNKDELKQFLSCVDKEDDPKWSVLFRLLAFSGMRKGEALGLQWQKIDFECNTITVDQTLTRGENNTLIIQDTKTNAGTRTISMDPVTMTILKDWRTQQRLDFLKHGINTNKPDQYVFTTNQTNAFVQHANLTNVINRVINKNNLKRITVHQLRHSHCSLLFEAGAQPLEVKERLGHSDISITLNIYAHVTEKTKDKTADMFAQHVGF